MKLKPFFIIKETLGEKIKASGHKLQNSKKLCKKSCCKAKDYLPDVSRPKYEISGKSTYFTFGLYLKHESYKVIIISEEKPLLIEFTFCFLSSNSTSNNFGKKLCDGTQLTQKCSFVISLPLFQHFIVIVLSALKL